MWYLVFFFQTNPLHRYPSATAYLATNTVFPYLQYSNGVSEASVSFSNSRLSHEYISVCFSIIPRSLSEKTPQICLRNLDCISSLLSRLPKLPSQCYSNRPENVGNLGSNIFFFFFFFFFVIHSFYLCHILYITYTSQLHLICCLFSKYIHRKNTKHTV